MKGRKHSDVTISKMRASNTSHRRRGIPLTEKTKQKLREAHTGKKLTTEHKNKIRKALLGHLGGGWKLSSVARTNISQGKKGSKSHLWKGGITSESILIRQGIEYRLWREAVFARDNWTCQECHKRGCKLQAHHVKGFAKYPGLRFAIDNGKTLCINCHKKTANFMVKALYNIDILET